jgi:hypothetical protein
MRIYAKPYDDIKVPFTIDENGAFAEFIIQKPEEIHEDLVLGSTVLVFDLKNGSSSKKATPFWIAGRIVGMKAISPFNPERENMLYQEDETESPYKVLEEISGGPHHHQPMVLRVELDYEMETRIQQTSTQEADYFISPIQRPPSSFSRMFIPEIEKGIENNEPSLEKILNLKKRGVLLGCVGSGNSPFMKNEQFLYYNLDVFGLENKHIFIVGESGSGKTVFLKNLAFELRNLNQNGTPVNNRIIMLDVQGDIVQLLFPNLDDEVTLKPKIAWQNKANNSQLRSKITKDFIDEKLNPFRLILPKSKRSKRTKNASALKLLCENNNINVIEAGLRLQDLNLPSDVEYLMRINSQQAVTILDQYAEAFRNSGKTIISIQSLRNGIDTTLSQHVGKDTIPSKTTGTSYYRSSFDAAKRALDALEVYFDLDEEIVTSGRNPLDNLKEPGTTIIYLADLNQEERLMWEMLIVKWLNDNNDTINEEESNSETYVFIDEAHQIIPARPLGIADKDTFDRLRSNFERLAREGRKFGINLILSTQSPKDLHEIVPDQCPNKVVMKINPRNAEYAYLDKELALIASRFNYGQFWFQSPFNDTPHWLRLHSLATPIPHEPVKTYFPKVRKISKGNITGR